MDGKPQKAIQSLINKLTKNYSQNFNRNRNFLDT